jgi:hypothetical protein
VPARGPGKDTHRTRIVTAAGTIQTPTQSPVQNDPGKTGLKASPVLDTHPTLAEIERSPVKFSETQRTAGQAAGFSKRQQAPCSPNGHHTLAILGLVARITDNFDFIDADDLLRPLQNPAPYRIIWPGGEPVTYRLPVTFTRAAFGGRRAWFLCPRCQRRCRKLFIDDRYRAVACRTCLHLRYRSQRREK